MSDRNPRDEVRETVSGDRLCMQCLHPLAGSAVSREPATGLLYCRCVECGTAAALLEYPTITPWMRRMKSVAAAFFVTVVLIAGLGGIGIGGLFPSVVQEIAGEASANALVESYRRSGGSTRDPNQQFDNGRFAIADRAWLETDAGRSALRASRFSVSALAPFLGLALLGCTLLLPVAFLLGLFSMRRHPLLRAVVGALIPSMGGAIAVAGVVSLADLRFGLGPAQNISWMRYCAAENGPFFAVLMCVSLALFSALVAAVAAPLVAAMLRFVLPPRDRRLVAWIWEWRGKPIPKD